MNCNNLTVLCKSFILHVNRILLKRKMPYSGRGSIILALVDKCFCVYNQRTFCGLYTKSLYDSVLSLNIQVTIVNVLILMNHVLYCLT